MLSSPRSGGRGVAWSGRRCSGGLLGPWALAAAAVLCSLPTPCVADPDGVPAPEFLETLAPVEVFVHSQGHCYRIPTILRTRSGVLLAFAEQREESCSDQGTHALVLRRSRDGGATWGPLQVLVQGRKGEALSNPNPVEVADGDGARHLLMHYDTMNNPTPTARGWNMQLWSEDDGATWGKPQNISRFFPDEWRGCMPGPGVGVQQQGCGRQGTVYFSCHFRGWAMVYWSSDLGRTWHTDLETTQVKANECSVALLSCEELAMNCRTLGLGLRKQFSFRLAASGAARLTQELTPPGLIDPGCQGSLVAVRGTLYLSSDASHKGRKSLSVKQSLDGGRTWSRARAASASVDQTGYSQLVAWEGGDGRRGGGCGLRGCAGGTHHFGLLFESGLHFYAEKIVFASWSSRT